MTGTEADLGRPHRRALWPKRRASSASSKVIAKKPPWLNTFVSVEARGPIHFWNLQRLAGASLSFPSRDRIKLLSTGIKRSASLLVPFVSPPDLAVPFQRLGLLSGYRLETGEFLGLAFDPSVWFHYYPHRYLARFSFQMHLRNRRWDSHRLRFGFPRGPSEQARLWMEPYPQLLQAEIFFSQGRGTVPAATTWVQKDA